MRTKEQAEALLDRGIIPTAEEQEAYFKGVNIAARFMKGAWDESERQRKKVNDDYVSYFGKYGKYYTRMIEGDHEVVLRAFEAVEDLYPDIYLRAAYTSQLHYSAAIPDKEDDANEKSFRESMGSEVELFHPYPAFWDADYLFLRKYTIHGPVRIHPVDLLLQKNERGRAVGVRAKKSDYEVHKIDICVVTGNYNVEIGSGDDSVEFEPGSKSHILSFAYNHKTGLPTVKKLLTDVLLWPEISKGTRSTTQGYRSDSYFLGFHSEITAHVV